MKAKVTNWFRDSRNKKMVALTKMDSVSVNVHKAELLFRIIMMQENDYDNNTWTYSYIYC